MEESKAISPEVKGLFDLIHHQANEYSEAFDKLKTERDENLRQTEYLTNLSEKLKSEVKDAIVLYERNTLEFLTSLEHKSERINRIWDEMSEIIKFRDSLSQISDSIKRQSLELESSIEAFRAKSELRLDSTLNEIRSRVSSEIERETQRIEMRVIMRLRQLETKILNFDQKLFEISQSQDRQYRAVNEEFDHIKTKFNIFRQSQEDFRKHIETVVQDSLSEINERVRQFDKMFNPQEKVLGTKQGQTKPERGILFVPAVGTPADNIPEIKDFTKEIEAMRRKFEKVNTELLASQKKSTVNLTIAIVSTLLALVAILLKI